MCYMPSLRPWKRKVSEYYKCLSLLIKASHHVARDCSFFAYQRGTFSLQRLPQSNVSLYTLTDRWRSHDRPNAAHTHLEKGRKFTGSKICVQTIQTMLLIVQVPCIYDHLLQHEILCFLPTIFDSPFSRYLKQFLVAEINTL